MFEKQQLTKQDVTAIITAMTDDERPYLYEAVSGVLSDIGIGQVILCVDEENTWINEVLGPLKLEPRLEILCLPLAYPPTVRNKAIKHVKLPWIAYCDGDDVWFHGKTRKQRIYADQTNSDFVGADHVLIDEQGNIRAVAQARYIPMPSSWLVKTEVMIKHQFDESVKIGSDGEWWVRTDNLFKKTRLSELLVRYRVRTGSISSSTSSKRRKAKIVTAASIPILGKGILLITWIAWLLNRQNTYIWLPIWGQNSQK
jgi:glycosyltransferase involved in cell wall biosynthesis